MTVARAQLWFLYDDGNQVLRTNIGAPRVRMASYVYDGDRLVVWVDEVQDPNLPVIFLLTIVRRAARPWVFHVPHSMSFPHNVITDGERWCPLIKGNDRKYHSYPTGYTGIKLTCWDKEIIVKAIQDYVSNMLGDNDE